jgi:hypothetical protein
MKPQKTLESYPAVENFPDSEETRGCGVTGQAQTETHPDSEAGTGLGLSLESSAEPDEKLDSETSPGRGELGLRREADHSLDSDVEHGFPAEEPTKSSGQADDACDSDQTTGLAEQGGDGETDKQPDSEKRLGFPVEPLWGAEPTREENLALLYATFQTYLDLKKVKVQIQLRLWHPKNINPTASKTYSVWTAPEALEKIKEEAGKTLELLLKRFPIYEERLKSLKIGPVSSALLVHMLYSKKWVSKRFGKPSLRALYRCYGLLPDEKTGRLMKRSRGKSAGFRVQERALLIGKKGLADQLILHSGKSGPYYEFYVQAKEQEQKKIELIKDSLPPKSPLGVYADKRAKIRLVKKLLWDLWNYSLTPQNADIPPDSDMTGGKQAESLSDSEKSCGLDRGGGVPEPSAEEVKNSV